MAAAAANEGQQAGAVLQSMVVQPPLPAKPIASPDPLSLPSVRGDGAYGNAPTQQRAQDAGFRLWAPQRGQTRLPGLGKIRGAVERGHAWLAQFGRLFRRLDRDDRRYWGWIELAACIIFIRSGLVTPLG